MDQFLSIYPVYGINNSFRKFDRLRLDIKMALSADFKWFEAMAVDIQKFWTEDQNY